jgi:hypothetical protein
LAVDRDRKPVGEVGEVDAMPAAAEAKFDPVVYGAFSQHPLPDADFFEQFGRAVFEHAGPYRRLQCFAAAAFEHDGFDPLQVQKM